MARPKATHCRKGHDYSLPGVNEGKPGEAQRCRLCRLARVKDRKRETSTPNHLHRMTFPTEPLLQALLIDPDSKSPTKDFAHHIWDEVTPNRATQASHLISSGLTPWMADQIATRNGLHPILIWPDLWAEFLELNDADD